MQVNIRPDLIGAIVRRAVAKEIGQEVVRYCTHRGEFIGFMVRNSNDMDKLRSTGIEVNRKPTRVKFNNGLGKEKQYLRYVQLGHVGEQYDNTRVQCFIYVREHETEEYFCAICGVDTKCRYVKWRYINCNRQYSADLKKCKVDKSARQNTYINRTDSKTLDTINSVRTRATPQPWF